MIALCPSPWKNTGMDVVLFGTGWRARFFLRIARLCPSIINVVSVYSRSPERAKEIEALGFRATADRDKALEAGHDAVIVASGKKGFADTLRFLRDNGERIISETTFLSLSDEELDEMSLIEGGMVLEQYAFTPLFASVIAALPLLGNVDQMYLSGLHNHHAAAIARRVLPIGYDLPERIESMDFPSSMLRTGSRNGLERSGMEEEYTRSVRLMRFPSSLLITDFSSNQYHSYLYGKRFEVRGDRGVMNESGVRIVGADGYPVSLPFVFHRDASVGNGSLTLSHVTLGERTLFVNPYYPLNLNDDEIAIARMLELYGKGEDPYPFREGVADARLGRLL